MQKTRIGMVLNEFRKKVEDEKLAKRCKILIKVSLEMKNLNFTIYPLSVGKRCWKRKFRPRHVQTLVPVLQRSSSRIRRRPLLGHRLSNRITMGACQWTFV